MLFQILAVTTPYIFPADDTAIAEIFLIRIYEFERTRTDFYCEGIVGRLGWMQIGKQPKCLCIFFKWNFERILGAAAVVIICILKLDFLDEISYMFYYSDKTFTEWYRSKSHFEEKKIIICIWFYWNNIFFMCYLHFFSFHHYFIFSPVKFLLQATCISSDLLYYIPKVFIVVAPNMNQWVKHFV